jgi:multidrug transporter EmrE-like cation transporter
MTLSITHIFQLCSFALLLSCGQILFKYTAATSPALASVEGLIGLFFNLWFWAALVLYGIATLIWIFILQQVPLSLAYPFVALGFILVPLASHFLFKEPINLYYVLGTLLIIGGLGVITTLATR